MQAQRMLLILLGSFLIISPNIVLSKKIIGLIQARNEALVIEQCLHALSFHTDAIVVLDDASDDTTVAVVESVAHNYRVEKVIRNKTCAWLHGIESDNRQKLLDAGRSIGGTHFIVIDADEVLTANCAKNNFLRSIILRLNPGDRLMMNIMHAWGSLDRYRIYFQEKMKYFIFCDDGTCSYEAQFLHALRVPVNLSGGANLIFDNDSYGLLHLGYINWDAVLIRQAWYKCLERTRYPQKSIDVINSWYPCHKEKDEQTYPMRQEWLDGYSFFDATVFDRSEQWRLHQIFGWFEQYGKEFFTELEIWHINWNNKQEQLNLLS